MTLLRQAVQDAAVGVAAADQPDDLKSFLKPGCAAAIWRRQPKSALQDWIDRLDPETLPQGRLSLHRTAVRGALSELFGIAGTPACSERDWLLEDISALADLFADLMQVSHLRIRLDAVKTNACRKFHIDAITARLVCTYRGAGTQYGISRDGSDPARVFTTPTGAPILLRGTLWPEKPASGLLHRSPPIEGTNETRLVLVLDPIFDPEDVV